VLRCGVRLRLAARWVESVFFKGAQRYPTAREMAIEKRVDKDTVAPTHWRVAGGDQDVSESLASARGGSIRATPRMAPREAST